MVVFGTCKLPHALEAQIEKSRVEIERSVPYSGVAYRTDQTTRGRSVKVASEIRATTIGEAALKIELLRRLADDTTRLLDLEDGETPAFNAKLVDPQYALDVQDYWFQASIICPIRSRFWRLRSYHIRARKLLNLFMEMNCVQEAGSVISRV
jgi:hypothetical protein